MFDPDYRKSPWNMSKYAPKNSSNKRGTAITQISGGIAGIVGFGIFYFSGAYIPDNLQRFGVSFVVGFIVMLIIARILISSERKRLNALIADEQIIKDSGKKRTIAPRSIELHKMSATEFEEFVADVINKTTKYRAEVTGGANDKGVDVKVFEDKALIGVVQCKRYDPKKTLPPSFIRELATVKQRHNAKYAFLATTARFSEDSQREAQALGIRLLDGQKLQSMQNKQKSAQVDEL